MKLITKEIENKLPKLYSTENVPIQDKKVAVKFFTPDGNWTWYAVEGEKRDDDILFFGLVDGFELEWGYFTLNDIKVIRGGLNLPVERDMYFGNPLIKDISALRGRLKY